MTNVEAIGWVLVHFVWQGFAIAAVLAALLSVTPVARPAVRYALSCGALLLMLTAAIATAASVVTQVSTAPETTVSASTERTANAIAPSTEARSTIAEKRSAPEAFTPQLSGTPLSSRVQRMLVAAMPWMVTAWSIGVLLLSLRLAGGWWRTRSLRIDGIESVPEWCQERLAALAERLGVARPVAIVASLRVPVPIVIGHVKPMILLPAAVLAGLSPAHLDAIIAHELAHVRRHDYLVNLAQTVVETLLFYHPAVWWVSRQVRDAREHCCDDLAVAVCDSRTSYVRALLDMESLRTPTTLLALGITDGTLIARARRLLVQPQPSAGTPRLAASVIALAVVAVTGAAASFAREVPAELESLVAVSPATQSISASSIAIAPDQSTPIATRWTWAERSARDEGRSQYWIGYRIAAASALPSVVYIERSSQVFGNHMTFSGHMFSSDASGLRFGGRKLDVPGNDRAIKLLFRFDASRGTPALTAVHASSFALPVETRDLPIFWLGEADAVQSLEQVDRLYSRASTRDLQKDVIAAIGVHNASPQVVEWLERRIASGDSDELRADATEWLAWHPLPRSLTALDRIARNDRASRVRQEAAEALGDLPMPEAAPVLAKLSRELTDPKARQEAVEALGSRSEPVAQQTLESIARQDADLQIQRQAVETLGELHDGRGTAVLMELARTHPSIEVRREAIETLGEAEPSDDLVRLLKSFATEDNETGVQQEAIDTLAGMEHPAALTALIDIAQSHPRSAVRRNAIEAIAESHDTTKALSVLAQVAKGDRDIEVQLQAVESLGEIEGADSRRLLRELARTHANERVRAQAIETFGSHDESARDTADLLKSIAMADASEHVREQAIETLGELPDGGGVDALVDIAREHPDSRVQRRAIETLLDIDHPRARAALKLQKPAGR